MLWMLLVYVVASNGYTTQPTLTPSFHGATYPTREACAAAAKTVELYKSSADVDDIAKIGMVVVCAPVLPAPVVPAPQIVSEPAQAQDPFPSYSPAPPPKRK